MTLAAFLETHGAVIRVALTRVRGSSPREAGTEMFVAGEALYGTIGGGQLEHRAVEAARAMLRDGALSREMDVPLGPEIGQCCGGRVELSLQRMRASDKGAALDRAEAETAALPHVYVMGAGHVGRALADLLQHLPMRTILVDPRAGEIALCTAAVETRVSAIPEVEVANAPAGSAFVVLTHDHGLDFLLTSAALERGDAAYVGMIGSATKRAKLRSWMRQHCGPCDFGQLTCPIGAQGSGDKRPALIAAFVVAEVLAELTRGERVTGRAGSGQTPERGHHHDQKGASAR
ncbi:xanthine dehydrogenase accessory protein XdhC [Salipiger bermudensis]|uniref:xanthine dehydrogenase accessory protein XdhC n=1 Tax=Salipiger bermudensis TaxID=344736 RepID=UPI001CD34A29|nr:xanthine dehydrogenase accessory protein XdhC [Salipiger bermudensis]MCA0963137.1 xanthine dehydrogenase accessory protein XdhC [Salipiger bermudensis]